MDDSDDDIVVLEEIKSESSAARSKNWKWKAANPMLRAGGSKDILNQVRSKLNMENPVIMESNAPFSQKSKDSRSSVAKKLKASTSAVPSVKSRNSKVDLPTEKLKVSVVSKHVDESSDSKASSSTVQTQVDRTPKKSVSADAVLTLTPEQIHDLTFNCLDSDNEPDTTPVKRSLSSPLQREAQQSTPKRTLNFNVKASNSLRNRASKYFGAGTSSDDVVEILVSGTGFKSRIGSPSKSPSPKKRRLSKNSPIRQLPCHRNLGKSPGKRSPAKRIVDYFSPKKMSPGAEDIHDIEDNVLPGGPYYCEAFCYIIKKVFDHTEYHHLFLQSELKKMKEIGTSKKEIQLYVRLMNRKDKWHRTSDISYNDIADELSPLFDILESQDLLSCDVSEEKLDDLLKLLKVDELKTLCTTFRVKKTGNKPDLMYALLSMHKTQPTLAGTSPLLESVKGILGRCIRLKPEWRLVFRRCILLFSMFHCYEDLDKLSSVQALLLLQVKLGNMTFPLKSEHIKPSAQIFASRDQLIRYEEAKIVNQDLNFAMETKDFGVAEELTRKCMKQFSTLLELTSETNHVVSLPPFLQRFCAGSSYSYTLTKCVEAMKQSRNFPLALDILQILLDQKTYRPHYKARWALMKASLLHINLKDIVKACEVLCSVLKDKMTLSSVDRMHLQQRAEKVIKLKKNGLSEELKVQLRSVMDPPWKPPGTVEICARAYLGSKPGLKKVYIRDTEDGKEFMSVEEIVLAHYRSLGFKYGVHDEGSTISSLCLLSLWNYIYDISVPSVFQSPYQEKPLDWGSKAFYETRRNALEAHFSNLLSRDVRAIAEELCDLRKKYSHITSVVNWDRIANLDIHAFLDCVSIPVFVGICRRLVEDWKSNRSGFPDLIVWCPPQKKCLFVEVKSPNDTLSTVQYLWLSFLKMWKANAMVAHVKESGSKSCGIGIEQSK